MQLQEEFRVPQNISLLVRTGSLHVVMQKKKKKKKPTSDGLEVEQPCFVRLCQGLVIPES